MYNQKKISLILPTYNEKDSIKKVINDFEGLNIIDEIIVINNNATEGTSEEVKKTTAIEYIETAQGYGSAIQRGFREATGDLIVVCEPDDTFLSKDILKLLVYSEDVDIVYGSRTQKEFIWSGANMGWFLRVGNWAVAKLMEVLFNTNPLTDVGCTYRLINKKTLDILIPLFKVKSNFFGPEMMIKGYLNNIKSIQIPIVYKERVGESSVTGDFRKAFGLGIKMILLIFILRFNLERPLLKFLK
jgi:glycosyltransferase involved in cell wall biosynthesis